MAHRTAMIDVGGGFRAIYGAGVMDRMLEDGIHVDHCYGVSAGSANMVSYISGQHGRNHTFYTQYAFRKEYAAADPGVTVTLAPAEAAAQALTEEATLRVIHFLLLVPNGIAAMSMDIPGLVQTSCNLGIFHVEDGVLTAVSSVRSSVSSQKQMLLVRIDALAQLLGGSLHVTGAYPAWEYRRESPLRDKLAAVYTQQTGKEPKIEAIHAGLECGLFAGQLPGLDCVSFGPDLVDIHTTREKMSISSVQRTWQFLLGALAALKD